MSKMLNWLQQRPGAVLVLALLVTTLVYTPGLSGGFVYDDFPLLVRNSLVHVDSLAGADWLAAANAYPAAHQGRWLGMLSFAANYYLGGDAPLGFKVTNLAIHLANGVLLWLMLVKLLRLHDVVKPTSRKSPPTAPAIALLITAYWLILPINLTPVLYVAQRLESLSNSFVLIGLCAYLQLRLADWRGQSVAPKMVSIIFCCSAVGALVKESALLLPLYIAGVEVFITRMQRHDQRWSRAMIAVLIMCLIVPFIAGSIWLFSWMGSERSYSRDFNSSERLLTQGRVLLSYVRWTLLPNLSELTLNHDDFAVSRGLLAPWTTLPTLFAIAASMATAWWLRRRLPLFSLGIFWYFAGHALTSTIIPLLLAFEHRNYFPSIGLLLAVAALANALRGRLRLPLATLILASIYVFYGGTTLLRATEWRDPARLAASEAAKRPGSANAQYDYILLLVRSAGDETNSPLRLEAIERLKSARRLPGAGINFEQALIILEARQGQPNDPALWQSMRAKMLASAPTVNDVTAAIALFECMQSQECPAFYLDLRLLTETMLAWPSVDANLYSMHAVMVYRAFSDWEASMRSFAAALTRLPENPAILYNRALILIDAKKFEQAREAIADLERLNALGSLDHYVVPLKERLAELEKPGATR